MRNIKTGGKIMRETEIPQPALTIGGHYHCNLLSISRICRGNGHMQSEFILTVWRKVGKPKT